MCYCRRDESENSIYKIANADLILYYHKASLELSKFTLSLISESNSTQSQSLYIIVCYHQYLTDT